LLDFGPRRQQSGDAMEQMFMAAAKAHNAKLDQEKA
jgi:hypothetical protein